MSNANVTIPPATEGGAAPAPAPNAAPPPPAPPPVAPAAPAPAPAPPPSPQAAPAPTAAPTPPTPPTPAAGAPPNDPSDPSWLKPRLQREREATLRSLGFASEAEAKAASDAVKAKAEADKTHEQRAREANEKLAVETATAARMKATLGEYAARMMVGLTPEQKAAVTNLAGDDPERQVAAITTLAPTWAAAAPAPTAPAPAPAAAPAPSTTAPPAGAPTDGVPPAVAPRAAYEQIRSTNPFAAAAFGDTNPDVYTPKR